MVAAIERAIRAIPAASDIVIVEGPYRRRRQERLYSCSTNRAVRVPSLFELDDHELPRGVVADATNETALWRVSASEG